MAGDSGGNFGNNHDSDDRKDVAKTSQSNPELSLLALLGGSITDRLTSRAMPADSAFQSDAGKPLGEGESGPRVRCESTINGRKVLIYADKDAALEQKPAAIINFTYKDSGNATTEVRSVFGGEQQKSPMLTTETTLNRQDQSLTIKTTLGDKTTTAKYGDAGKPTELQIKNEQTGQAFSFELKDGRIAGVVRKESNGFEESLQGEKLGRAVRAGESALNSMAKENGLAQPFVHSESRVEKELTSKGQPETEAEMIERLIDHLTEASLGGSGDAGVQSEAIGLDPQEVEDWKGVIDRLSLVSADVANEPLPELKASATEPTEALPVVSGAGIEAPELKELKIPSDQSLTASNELALVRDSRNRISQVRQGENAIAIKYEGDGQESSGFEILGKDGKSLKPPIKHDGPFRIDERTGNITVGERTGGLRLEQVYSPDGSIRANEYDDKGLRTKQTLTTREQDGSQQKLTTDYRYASENGSLKVEAVQTDEKSRVTERSLYASAAAVEAGKPCISERVSYQTKNKESVETQKVTDLSNRDRPKTLSETVKTTNSNGEISIRTNLDLYGVETKVSMDFNADGKATSFTREQGKDKFSFSIEPSTGKLNGVKLNDQPISDQKLAETFLRHGQIAVDSATVQHGIRSAENRARRDFLNPESSSTDRANAMEQLKQQALTKTGHEKTALERTVQTYEAINLGAKIVSLAGNEIEGEVAQFAKEAGQAAESEKSLAAMAQIADGRGGDKEQTRAARDVLLKLAADSPEKREKIVQALAGSGDSSTTHSGGALEILGKVASMDKNTSLPPEVKQALVRGLESSSPQRQQDAIRGLDQLLASGQLSARQYTDAVKNHMTPAVTREMQALPKALLDKDNLRAELMDNLDSKLKNSNVKGLEREHAIEAMVALGGTKALLAKATTYGLSTGISGEDSTLVEDNRARSRLSFDKYGDNEKLGYVQRGENGSSYVNWYDPSGKFKGTRETQYNLGDLERNENYEVKKVSPAAGVNASDVRGESQFESPRSKETPTQNTSKALQDLQSMAGKYPPDAQSKQAEQLLAAFGSNRQAANERVNQLLLDLNSDNTTKQGQAMKDIQSTLGPTLQKTRVDATKERILQGMGPNSGLSELAKDQADLAKLAAVGDKDAERMLYWTEAMKSVAQLRDQAATPAGNDVQMQRDVQGRINEIRKDGVTIKLGYKDDGGKQPSSVELLSKSGESIAKHEGQISVNSKTGEVSFSRRLGDKNNLERMDVKYSPGGKIEGNQYDANGLRTQQTLSELQSNGEMKNATTVYSYRGADGKPTDNPLKVTSATATTTDVESKEPSRIQKFNSFAAVELNLPSVLQSIERRQSELSKSETLTITDARDPAKPQVVGKISIETDFTGERTVTETSMDEKTSQKVRFDSGGTVNNFARTVGNDKFSYEVNAKGQVSRVFKNNTEVEGETGNALKNEGNKLLEAMTQQYGIGSRLDVARADFLNPEASAQAKAQAIEQISEEARLNYGDARTTLENTVQSYKAIALAGEVVSLAGNDIRKEVAKVSQEAGQIVGFEKAVDRLAQIASGSGGDKEQTSKAQAALVKLAAESPDKRERIMSALVKGGDKSSGSVPGVLDTLGKVAALDKNSAAPPEVTKAILKGLDAKSPIKQLDAIRGLNQLLMSDRLSSKEYLEAVKGHMTPAVVREVKDLPKDVLDGKNLRVELMADLSTKIKDSNVKDREREHAIEAMAALGGTRALQEKASEYGVKLDAGAGNKSSMTDTKTGAIYSFLKYGEEEKLVRITRSEGGSNSGFSKNLFDDKSGKFIGTSEFQKGRGIVERNENLEVTMISTAKDVSPSELLDKSERKVDGPGDRAAAELEKLAAMTIGNKTAGELYGRLGGFADVENLKLRLKSEDNSVRNAAMDELKQKLSGAINEQVNNHRTAVSVNGVNQDSSFADFSKIQPALIRETQAGNKSAEKWLNWSQGMKHAEQIRQAELSAKAPGVTVASDPSGRAMEVKSGGVSTTFKYEGSNTVPASIEIKRPGSEKVEIVPVRGDLKLDERTGDITMVNGVDGGVGQARVETSISADGKLHTTTYDTDGRPVQLQKGDTTTRLNYREDNNSLSSLDITKLNAQGKPTTERIDLSHVKIKVPNDNISGEFVERRVKSDGPAKFDPRTGDISISQRSGGDSSLSRMDVKISPDGKVAASVYDTSGMRTSQTVTEVGQSKPESTIKYTYVGENGKLADNPLAIKVVMAEESNSDNEIVERNMFYSFAAVETNKPALRETIEKQAEKNNKSVEIHRFEDVSDPTNVQRVGEVKRTQDSITNAVTIESAMLKDGVKLYEKATFSGSGKLESYSREGAYTAKYNYTVANGRITDVKGVNLTEIGDRRDSNNPETQKAMRAEGEALLQQMQSQYKIENTHDLEGLRPTGWVKDQRPASGTLVIKNQGDQQNGGYESFSVAAGKIRGRDGTEIGKLTNDGLVQFSDGRKPDRFNICDTEGAAFHGTAGEGSDRIRIDMVSRQQENGFTGLLTESPGGKEFKVIGGNIFDGNKFVGHLDQNGRVHSDTGGGPANPPQWLNQFKRNAKFEGTEDGKPRVMDLTSSAPNGKMFIPDAETGGLVEHEVRMGMVIDKHTGQQLGRLEPPSPNADKSLSGGELTLMNGEKVNLSDLTRASFSLTKPGVHSGARDHEKIEGLCLGPQARLANGEPNPDAGGLLSLSKAREANNQMLQVAWNEVAKYRQSGDLARGWQVVTGVSDSTQQTIRHQVNIHQQMHARAEGDLKAISEGHYDAATIKQLQDRTLVREIIAGRDNLGLKRQQLDAAPTNFESLPADPTKIRGSVTVPTMDSTGKVIGQQEYPVVGGAIVGPDGNPLGRIENEVDKSTGRLVQQGALNMPDPRNPGKQLKTMGDLEGAVWKLDVPGQAPGQTQRLNWISVGGEKGIASAQALTRDARKETEYASAANRILQSDKSKDAVKESVEKYDAYVSRVNEIIQKGVQSKEDLDFLKRGPKEQVAADAYKPEANRPPRIARAELPANMKDVEGRLRMGDKVFEVKDGKLIDQVSKLPIGEIQSGYKVKFNDGRQVNLNTEPGVLMQWKGADGQTHNLIGLGPGATIKNFGWQQGGLVDVKCLKEQASEIQKEAAGHKRKYFEERPWITGAMGNAWMGDPEKAMGDLNATLDKYQRDLDRTVALYFGTGDGAGKYGGDYNASKPSDGFNRDLFSKGPYKREGSPGEVNVSSQSLCLTGDTVQILISTMGSTAQDLGELSREAAQVQQQIADSAETAAMTVATAGAGAYFVAAARAGQMSRGAAALWQVGAGVGFGGSASVLSMSDKSDGLAHVASGSIKGLAMSVPGAVSTLRLASGTGQAASAVAQVEQVAVANATSGLARFGAKTLDYSGRALGAVEKVPGVTTAANSVFQSTMFAAADWAKDGFKIDKLSKHFDPTKLGVSAGAMFFAHGAGKALSQSSDKLGERVGKVVAGTERGQAVLASKAGQRIFGSEVDQATGKASLWAVKQNEQKLVSGVINGMSNAYAFGAAGASHEAIQGEKARVAEKLGLMKRDKDGNLVPNEDMVGTGSSMFSFQKVLGTMHEAGLSAMATLGPLAYPSHKVTQHLIKGVEAKAAAERKAAAAQQSGSNVPRESLEQSASYLDARAKDLQQRREELQRKPDMPGQEKLLAQADKQIQENDRQRLANKAEQLDRLLQPWAAEIVPRQQKQQELIKGLVDQGIVKFGDQGKPELQVQPSELSTKQRKDLGAIGELQTELDALAKLMESRGITKQFDNIKSEIGQLEKTHSSHKERSGAEGKPLEEARQDVASKLPVDERLRTDVPMSVEATSGSREAINELATGGKIGHAQQLADFARSLDLSKPEQKQLALDAINASEKIGERNRSESGRVLANDPRPAQAMIELAKASGDKDVAASALKAAGKLGDIQHLQPILEVANKPALDHKVKLEALRAADHVGGHVNARQGMLELAKSATDPTIAKDLMKSLRQTYGSGEIHGRDLEALSQLKSPVGELASRELADREAVRRGGTPRRGETPHEFRDGAVKKEAPPDAAVEQKRPLDQGQKKLLEGEVQAVLAVDGTTSGHQIYQGIHIGADGKQSKVYVRTPGEEVPQGEPFDKRVQYENAARAVNEALKFGTGYPAMVERDVKIGKEGHTARAAVQQDAGIALDRAGDQLPRRQKPDEKRAFESQLEKAFVARLIMGDQDFHGHNFAVHGKGTDVVISNLDLGRGFGQHEVPKWGRDAGSMPGFTELAQARLAGEPLTEGTRQEIRAFVARSKTPEGQKELRESGLTEQQQAAVVKRAEWLAENGRFPELKVRESGDTRPLELDKSASERKPADITDPSAFDKPPGNKVPGGNEQEPATPDKGPKLVPKEPVKHEGNNATLVGDKDGNVVRTEGGNVLIHRSDLIDNFGTILQIDPKTLENTTRYQKLDVKGPNGETYYLNKDAAKQPDKERAPDSANDKYLKVVDSLPGVKEVMAAPELKEVRPDQLESRQKDVAERRSDAVEQAKKHVAELGDRLTIPERKVEKLENLKDLVQNTGETREVKQQELQVHLAKMSPTERAREFKRLGIESFEDFATLALKPESKVDMAVFKVKGHDQLEILIPMDYVKVLDQVRELRQTAQNSPVEATRKLDELRQKAADSRSGAERLEARKVLDAYDRAILPEEVVQHLKDLPDGGKLIKEIVLSDKPNPGDAWHTQEYNQKKLGKTRAEFESLATADIPAGKITFHPSQDYQRSGVLPVILSHEWSHLLEATAKSRPGFDAAANLENAGGEKGKKGAFVGEYATYNNHEDWAVHIGEIFLGKGRESTDRFAGLVQIAKESGDSKYKLLVMAKALEDVLTESERSRRKPATEEESRSREALKDRIDYLRKELGGPNDQARRELVDRLSSPTVTTEQARDLAAVLGAIGDRTHAQQLIELSKTTKSDDVASEIVRAAGQLGGESHSNQLIELAKSTKDATRANQLLNAAADAYRNDHPVPGQDNWAGNKLPVEKLVELSKTDGPARDWALNEIMGSFNDAHKESLQKREAAREEIVKRMESGEILQLFKEGKIDGQRLLYNLSASSDAAQQKRVFDSAMKHLADAPTLRDEYLATLLHEDLPTGKLAVAELSKRAPADKDAVRLLQRVADDSSHSLQQQAKGVLAAAVESQAAKTAQPGEVAVDKIVPPTREAPFPLDRSVPVNKAGVNEVVQAFHDQIKAVGDNAAKRARGSMHERFEAKQKAIDEAVQKNWPVIEKQVKDAVLQEAKRTNLVSRDSLGKSGDSIIKPENIRVVYERGGPQGGYDAKTNTIEINLASAVDVANVIKHELRHARDLVERTAFFKADPAGYKARVQEDVLKDLGSAIAGRRLESAGPDKYKVADRVQYNQQDSRTYAREALKDYLKNNGDKPLPSEGELHVWLNERQAKLDNQAAQEGKKAPPLSVELQDKGGLKQLASDMRGEIDHYQNVLKNSKISDEALKANPDMAKEIERRGQGYRERAERYAEGGKTGIEANPELLKLTRGLSTETVGAVGPGASAEYGLSPAELNARRVEAAARLKVEVQKLAEELGLGPGAPKSQLKERFQKDSMFGTNTPYPDIKLNNLGIEMHKALDQFQKLANQPIESKSGATTAEAAKAEGAQQEAKDKAWATAQEAARKMLPLLSPDEKYSQNTVKLLYKNGLISREDVRSLAPHFEVALDKSSKK